MAPFDEGYFCGEIVAHRRLDLVLRLVIPRYLLLPQSLAEARDIGLA
jgi:hypothetical protein